MSTPPDGLPDLSRFEAVFIGGSAGSFPVVNRLLEKLPATFPLPIVMCLHRLKDKREGFKEALEIKSNLVVNEPNDKDPIRVGHVYLAPANYHLLVETRQLFSLATTEVVQYSRPSIDVLFESVADVYGDTAMAILLSGANRDGAAGMARIKQKGGYLVVQDPAECSMSTMPEAALKATAVDKVLTSEQIAEYLLRNSPPEGAPQARKPTRTHNPLVPPAAQ
jgi:two-component system chemotaxis response regulator CheB